MDSLSNTPATVSAVVVTRNRLDMLRKTLNGILESVYPITEIVVSDDGSDHTTKDMLAEEYPTVLWVQGPQKGIAPNRNNGIRATHGDYILLTDDDVVVDPHFIGKAIELAQDSQPTMFFAATSEFGNLLYPNALDFLGFATVPYGPSPRYTTANQHCFLVAREITQAITYDEDISAYGYEEWDYAYRVASSGYSIQLVQGCANLHLAPMTGKPPRVEQDASRLYVTFKRHFYIDHKPLAGLAFLGTAIPHHLLSGFKRAGMKGMAQAWNNVFLAKNMLRQYQRRKA